MSVPVRSRSVKDVKTLLVLKAIGGFRDSDHPESDAAGVKKHEGDNDEHDREESRSRTA
jgi:hypothetical protein